MGQKMHRGPVLTDQPEMYAKPDGHDAAMEHLIAHPGMSYEEALEHVRRQRSARTFDVWGRPVPTQ